MEMKEIKKEMDNNPIGFLAPLLFGDNKKIGGIASICFETALECSSNKMGYCKICKYCYGISDAKRYRSHAQRMEDLSQVMTFIKGNEHYIDIFCDSLEGLGVNTLRYNLVGDFRNEGDIDLIGIIAQKCPSIKVYGYSKRFDLMGYIERLVYNKDNLYCGVPKYMHYGALNNFEPIFNIEDWDKTPLKCLGDCERCKKCYTLKGVKIACFIHGSPSKIQGAINTLDNYNYMVQEFNKGLNLDIPEAQALPSGFFCKKLNILLEGMGFNMPYHLTDKGNKSYELKTVKDLLKFARGG
jgi:hypothetical protein